MMTIPGVREEATDLYLISLVVNDAPCTYR